MFNSLVARRLVKSSFSAKSMIMKQSLRPFSLLVPLPPKDQLPAEVRSYPLSEREFT